MTDIKPLNSPSRFFDHVLAEMTAGKAQDGVAMLLGMFDALALEPALFEAASREIREHPLAELLKQDPLFQVLRPDRTGTDALARDERHQATTSRASQRLFDASNALTPVRALVLRRESAAQMITRAWRKGHCICISDFGDPSALAELHGHDGSNLLVIEPDPVRGIALRRGLGESLKIAADPLEKAVGILASQGTQFDLICASELADRVDGAALASIASAAAACLRPGGALAIAALVPGHLGAGWRRAYLGSEAQCHDPADLAAIASACGLQAKTYQDATECVVWCEMRRPAA